MADVTIDDVLEFLKGTVRPYDGNNQSVMAPERGVNPTKAFREPYTTARANPPSMPSSMDAEIGPAAAPAAEPEKQSAIQAWMAKYLPALSGPLRAAGSAAQMPFRAGADLARRGVHGAFGLEETEPYKYSGKGAADILEALGDTAAPLKGGADSIREALIAGGARPAAAKDGAFAGNPAARSVAEGVPTSGPVPGMPSGSAPRVGARTAGPAGGGGGDPQGGAFARTAVSNMEGGGAGAGGTVPGPLTQEGAFAAPQGKSLAEEFRKRSGEIGRDADGKLTPEQKANAELNFFLGLMAKSAKPGSRMLGAFGESGQEALKGVGEQEEKNLTRGERKIQQKRDDLYKEMGFADKDSDNARGDKRQAAEERRWQATDKKDTERLQIMRDQLEQANWKVVNNGKTGTVTLVNTKDGSTKDTGVKIDRGDTRPAEVRLLEHLRGNPKDLETLLQLKGRDGTKGDITEQGEFRAAMDLLKGDMTGKMEPADASARVRKLIEAQRGGGAVTLPAGIPQGSKQVGTAKGKPVYEAPNGKRYTVE